MRLKFLKSYGVLILSFLIGFLASVFYSSEFSLRQEATFLERLIDAFYNPLSHLMTKGKDQIIHSYSFFFQTYEKAQKYDKLVKKVEHISYLETQIHFLERENQRLKELLKLTRQEKNDYLAVKIRGRDPTYVFDSLKIDLGEKAGIKPGQGVICTKGVVGTVFRTWKNTSDVLVVTDPNAHLDAIIERNNMRVILSGNGHQELLFKHSNRQEPVLIGDRLVTSGYTGNFPAGLPIGFVSKVITQSLGQRQVFVIPEFDLGQISEALVIQQIDPYMSLIEAEPLASKDPDPISHYEIN